MQKTTDYVDNSLGLVLPLCTSAVHASPLAFGQLVQSLGPEICQCWTNYFLMVTRRNLGYATTNLMQDIWSCGSLRLGLMVTQNYQRLSGGVTCNVPYGATSVTLAKWHSYKHTDMHEQWRKKQNLKHIVICGKGRVGFVNLQRDIWSQHSVAVGLNENGMDRGLPCGKLWSLKNWIKKKRLSLQNEHCDSSCQKRAATGIFEISFLLKLNSSTRANKSHNMQFSLHSDYYLELPHFLIIGRVKGEVRGLRLDNLSSFYFNNESLFWDVLQQH